MVRALARVGQWAGFGIMVTNGYFLTNDWYPSLGGFGRLETLLLVPIGFVLMTSCYFVAGYAAADYSGDWRDIESPEQDSS